MATIGRFVCWSVIRSPEPDVLNRSWLVLKSRGSESKLRVRLSSYTGVGFISVEALLVFANPAD